MDRLEWAELRQLATLVHAVPGLHLRVSYGPDLVLAVAPSADPAPPEGAITACRFRAAVARAWSDHGTDDGGFLGPGGPGILTLDLDLPPHGVTFPGPIHRVPLADRLLYVLATTSPSELAQQETAALTQDQPDIGGVWGIGLRPDPATEVCLAYCEVDVAHDRRSGPQVVELLQSLAARIATRRLIEESAVRWSP